MRATASLALGCLLLAACTGDPDAAGRAASTPSPTATVSPSPIDDPAPSDPATTASPSPTPSPTADAAMLGAFDADRALEVATQLAAGGPRPAGTDADRAARFQLSMALWAAGWDVEERVFSLPQGGESANLVASIGSPEVGPHVVIGGHHDTVAGSPGANDNGSGLGILVALAEELADEAADLPVPVILVAFGAEEYQPSSPRQHHIGSENHAANPLAEVVAMLSVDMVGHGDTLCICWFAGGPPTLAERLRAVAADTGVTGVEVRSAPGLSDHAPFARRGVPAALLWTGPAPGYHGPGDTADLLRRDDVDRAGRLVLAFVRSLTEDDLDGLE